MSDNETIRIAELYGAIRRYSGLLGNFVPPILDMHREEVEQLERDIETYQRTVPRYIQDGMFLVPIYMEALKSECRRRLTQFQSRGMKV